MLALGCSDDDTSATTEKDAGGNVASDVTDDGGHAGSDAASNVNDTGAEVSYDSGFTDVGTKDGGGLADSSTPAPIIDLSDGPIEGAVAGSTLRYMGIPFAAPPTGTLRWRPPQPVEPWQEVRDASEQAFSCIQFATAAMGDPGETSEDCLYLNVWTPDVKPAEPLPVMLWLHGGANVTGSSVDRGPDGHLFYDGQSYIESAPRPVVVVTANYRLGRLGFLAHAGLTAEEGTSGNYALMDQQAALRWVRDNISAFGGDPENVTLFGESAGAQDAFLLLMAPESKGLFHRAILESPPNCYSWRWRWDLEQAEVGGAAFADFIGCSGADDAEVVNCLRDLSVEELKKTAESEVLPGGFMYQEPLPYRFQPIIDGVILPDRIADIVAADQYIKIPVIVGTNASEGTLFHHDILGAIAPANDSEYKQALQRGFGDSADAVAAEYPISDYDTPNDALIDVSGDSTIICQARNLARALTDQGGTVFEYNYAHAVGFGIFSSFGPTHAAELSLVWGGAFINEDATASDKALGATIFDYWTRFAYTGDPNGDDAPQWPRFETDTEPEVVLADPVSTIEGRKSDKCDFWANIE